MTDQEPQPDTHPNMTDSFATITQWLLDIASLVSQLQLDLNHLKARLYQVEEKQS